MERKKVLREINIDTDMFLTSFDKAASLLLQQKQKLEKEGWSNIHLGIHHEYLIVMGMRLENDKEYEDRMKEERTKQIRAEKKLLKEKELFEKLKNKFEK